MRSLAWPWKKTPKQKEAGPPKDKVDLPAESPPDDGVTEPEQPPAAQRAKARQAIESLTPRERDVLGLLVKGRKLQEVADALGIQYSTANTHQKSVYKKLGVNSRAECIIRYGNLGEEW